MPRQDSRPIHLIKVVSMTLRETLDRAYDSMSLPFFEMADNLVIAANNWAKSRNIEINPWEETLKYLKVKL